MAEGWNIYESRLTGYDDVCSPPTLYSCRNTNDLLHTYFELKTTHIGVKLIYFYTLIGEKSGDDEGLN